MASNVVKFLEAAQLAAHWHAKQRRKGAAAEPYINHLFEVAKLIAIHVDEPPTHLLIAALLHDAIEDQGISPEDIGERFGDSVLQLVQEVSDDKTLPKEVRKQLQVESASLKSREAKTLILADKISNLSALVRSPPTDWTPARALEYVHWSRRVIKGVRGVCPSLEAQFDTAANAAEQAIMRQSTSACP